MADRGVALHTDGDREVDAARQADLSQGKEDGNQASVPAWHPQVPENICIND